jgi:hypothetical protein
VDDDHAKGLGLRAVACKGFRWMAGMKLVTKADDECYRLTYIPGDYTEIDPQSDDEPDSIQVIAAGGGDSAPAWGWPSEGSGWAPDFRDPATFGCLLALAQEHKPDLWSEIVAFMVEDFTWGSMGMIEYVVEVLEAA